VHPSIPTADASPSRVPQGASAAPSAPHSGATAAEAQRSRQQLGGQLEGGNAAAEPQDAAFVAAWPASAAEQQTQQAAQQQVAQLEKQLPRSASTDRSGNLMLLVTLPPAVVRSMCADSSLANSDVAASRRSSSEVQSRASSEAGEAPNRQPIMGLPPRDPRSKSKNMAMKLINKIGNKQPKKQIQAPQYPGLSICYNCCTATSYIKTEPSQA
jgi:hypothetical protein